MTYFLKKKKWMAWVVLLTFLFTSFMPSNLLAGNSVAEAAGKTVQDQIVLNPAEKTVTGADGKKEVKIQKSIAAGTNENEFNITLQVKTPENLDSIPSSADAAVVLVMDVSGSMDYSVSSKNHTKRIDAARNAAKAFARAFSDSRVSSNDKRLVSIVAFSEDATRKLLWNDVKSVGENSTNINSTLDWFKESNTDGGTNMEGGLQLALNLINAGKAQGGALEGIDNVTVILLTDGCPTYHIDGSKNSTTKIEGERGGGDWAKKVDYEPVIGVANQIKATQVNGSLVSLKTIALSTGNAKFEGIGDNVNLKNWLGNNVSTTYGANDTDSLVGSFEQINTLITLGTQAWLVKDPMATNIVYTGRNNSTESEDNSYTFIKNSTVAGVQNNTLLWDLKRSKVLSSETIAGTTWYTYQLTYPIRLDNTVKNVNFTATDGVFTNNTTTLDYFMFSKVNDGDKVKITDMKHADFDVPKVKGFAGSLNLTKTDLEGASLKNAALELQYLCNELPKDSEKHNENAKSNVPSGTSGDNGQLTLNNIPSGHTYKLVETKAPDGYEAGAVAKYAVKVSFGDVTYCELTEDGNLPSKPNWTAIPSAGLSLTNKKLPGEKTISVTKNWVIPREITQTPAIKLELLQDGKSFALDTEKYKQASNNVKVENGHTYIELAAQSSTQVVTDVKVPQYKTNGSEYVYTVQEIVNSSTPVVNGPVDIAGEKWNVSTSGLTVTNTYIGETSVSGSKTWVDPAGTEHPTITINLLRDGEKVNSTTLANGVTSYSFSNLPKYDLTDGHVYAYTVEEEAVAGYTSVQDGTNFTNTIEQDNTVEVSGTKTWIDPAGTEHPTITINLLRDGSKVDSKTLANGVTSYKFENLPKYDLTDGHVYAYTVEEEAVDGYTSVQNGNDFTNTIAQEYVEVSGTKYWNVPEDIKADVVPSQIEVQLFRDKDEEPIATTTATALNWTYSFTDLPKYDVDGDGHAYDYTVKEVQVPGFISVVNGFDIINTYDRSATTSVHVEKVWNDFNTNVGAHPTITIELYQNGILFETQELSNDNLELDFKELPKYDANQQPFTYTVKEVPVNGYTSTVSGSATKGFTITNTLVLGKPGTITVGKVAQGDNRPNADTRYKFELQIQVVHPEGRNALFDVAALNETTLGEAATAVNDALYAVQDSVMMTTSTSQYQYVLTEKANVFDTTAKALMGVEYGHTSPSAIIFEDGFMVEQSEIDSEFQYNITGNVLSALYTLSADYKADEIGDLLVALAEKVPMSDDGYTFTMDKAAVENLIEAVHVYNGLAGNLPLAPETDAPNALQVFQTINGVTTQSQLTFVENENGGYYKVDFWLASGDTINFALQATSGSAIYYRMVESLDTLTSANHTGTSIFDSVHGTTTSGTAIDFVAFDEDAAMNYVFTNSYSNNSRPTDPEDPTDPERPTNPDPEGPDIDIEDPDVPLAEPDEPPIEIEDPDVPLTDVPGEPIEIDEPEVPLGDAPKTGDSSNAIPFVVLMMVGITGLAITRRKFN